MIKTLWEFPDAATTIEGTPIFESIGFRKDRGRVCTIRFMYENKEGDIEKIQISFEGVQVYKCTFITFVTLFHISAYAKIVSVEDSDWLKTLGPPHMPYLSAQQAAELKHLMIFFDDGPCYEIICHSFCVDFQKDSRISTALGQRENTGRSADQIGDI